MDRPKSSPFKPYVSIVLAAAGVGYFSWQLSGLQGSIVEGRQEVQALRGQLDAERGERTQLEQRSSELARRAADLERAIADAQAAFASSGADVGESIRRMEARDSVMEASFTGLRGDVAAAMKRLDENGVQMKQMKRRLEVIAPDDYGALLAPTVKISSKSDVGSGTVIFSEKTGPKFTSYVLTAHHIVEQNYDARNPIPLDVLSFNDGRQVRQETGIVVAISRQLDLALIEVRSEKVYESVAKMIAPERVGDVRLYSRVNAIGCPLGYAPTPTSGELTSKNKQLDGHTYWMINAPTIFGNSGGGIYLSDTGEMIGVLSRISAYKNLIDVAVPHMGIMTSMNDVYSWLDRENYQFVVDASFGRDRSQKKEQYAEKTAAPAAAELPESLATKTSSTAPAATRAE
jgi:S1-C subfamily serine protease